MSHIKSILKTRNKTRPQSDTITNPTSHSTTPTQEVEVQSSTDLNNNAYEVPAR